MITPQDQNRIIDEAQELRREAGADNIYPVPLQRIVNHIGFKWHYFEPDNKLRDVSGAVNHEKKIIYSNNKETFSRQRFTVAHEIGHISLHHEGNIIDRRSVFNRPHDDKEYSANLFAAELIMPGEEFERVWIDSVEGIEFAANHFGVSFGAVRTRAEFLGLTK